MINPLTHRSPSRAGRTVRTLALLVIAALLAASCGDDDDSDATAGEDATTTVAPIATDESAETSSDGSASASTSVRNSGMTVTVQPAGDVTVHTLTAPEQVFANSTHIIETTNALVLIDTQFLLPNAADFRAYADSLGKSIDRVFITHEHPDHFLGSEAFADVPVYALAGVSEAIAANGDAEIEEKQGDFGADAIASTFVIPETVEAGSIEIDGTTFDLAEVVDAEAEIQLVIRVPEHGVIAVGDLIYSGVHLILAGPVDTWTTAIEGLQADSADYPVVLAGHGVPSDPSVYDANIDWLATAGELIGSVDNATDFKQGLVEAFPDLGMDAAIDFVTPLLFPEG